MEKLLISVLIITYVGKYHVNSEPNKCFVCTGPVASEDPCRSKQTPGAEQECPETETKCVTKVENDQIIRACAADTVADSDTVVTCAGAGCNANVWRDPRGEGNDTKQKKVRDDEPAATKAPEKPKGTGTSLVPMITLMILSLFIVLEK